MYYTRAIASSIISWHVLTCTYLYNLMAASYSALGRGSVLSATKGAASGGTIMPFENEGLRFLSFHKMTNPSKVHILLRNGKMLS